MKCGVCDKKIFDGETVVECHSGCFCNSEVVFLKRIRKLEAKLKKLEVKR